MNDNLDLTSTPVTDWHKRTSVGHFLPLPAGLEALTMVGSPRIVLRAWTNKEEGLGGKGASEFHSGPEPIKPEAARTENDCGK